MSFLPSVLLHRSPGLICDYQHTRALQGGFLSSRGCDINQVTTGVCLIASMHMRAHACVARATNSGLPAEDVAVETEPVLRQVEATLEEDVLLQSTGVVCG